MSAEGVEKHAGCCVYIWTSGSCSFVLSDPLFLCPPAPFICVGPAHIRLGHSSYIYLNKGLRGSWTEPQSLSNTGSVRGAAVFTSAGSDPTAQTSALVFFY